MRTAILAALALTLAGCETASENRAAMANPRQLTAKEIDGVLAAARDFLYDPYSVRDAEISTAVNSRGLDGGYTTMVCVKFNSKNAMGGYTGRQQYLLYLDQAGRVRGTNQDWSVPSFCNRMTYRTFTEANALRAL